MNTISEHEFIVNQNGELVLLLNTLSDQTPEESVFLVSTTENIGYLKRDSAVEEIHQIIGISPTIIDRVRGAQEIMVIEMTDETMVHTYAAITDLYIENDA